jgi:flavin-dependent dehydrogenase
MVADGATPPIEKPCGEGMMPDTLEALRALGVEIKPGEGLRFRGVCFVQEGTRVFADFPQGPGIGLRRPLLHERLVASAEACGVHLLWKTPVSSIDAGSVQLPCGKIYARWIVGSDGQNSRVRRWGGLASTKRNIRRYATRRHYRVKPWSNYMEIHWGNDFQAYVTPIGMEEVCIVVISKRAQHASFDRSLRDLPELRERLGGAELNGRERGAVTLMCSLHKVQRGNVALVGDASGGVDAITGEGLRLTFRQAFALANAMAANDLKQYEQAHRELARRPMLMANLMLCLGSNPRIRGRVIRTLKGKPDLFTRLLATHVGQGTSAELLSTGVVLSWRLLTT